MKKGITLIILTAIISGISLFLNAYGVKGLNPFAFTGAKNVLVAVLLLSTIVLATRLQEFKSLSKKQWGKLALIGLIGGSIPFLLFFKGLSMITGAAGAFLHKTMIIWVTLGALIFFREKLNWKLILGAFSLLAGNFLLLKLTGIELSAGLGYIFIATLLWSAELLLSKKTLQDVSGTMVAFGRMGFGALFILVYLAATGHINAIVSWDFGAWTWVLITSVFLLGYVWTFYNGLATVKVSSAVAILSFGSIITTLLQVLFLNAELVVAQIAGLLLITIGAIGIVWAQKEVHQESYPVCTAD